MQDAVKVLAAVKCWAAVVGSYARQSVVLGLLDFECCVVGWNLYQFIFTEGGA